MREKGRTLRRRGLDPALPELERMLTTTAGAHVKESKQSVGRRIAGARGPRLAAIGLTCLAFGGTAMAATGVWDPGIGSSASAPAPTISATPVPMATSEALGALSREPNAQDRGPEVQATLSSLGNEFANGIRPDSVRYLGTNASGEATILVSAESSAFTSSKYGADLMGTGEPVCVIAPNSAGDSLPFCFGLDAILTGRAVEAVESRDQKAGFAWGIVPDGVASVSAEFRGGVVREVPVTDNYFQYSWGDAGHRRGQASVAWTGPGGPTEGLVWHDADGNVVPQQPAG
jgi:hypothetical protein